ncbi:Synaptotagmin-16 [Hypsibius exemplaris]|uniref:Synaptotagmin-16 n=1 Tax=Hypsibius exemplaris TaxID=2072580 RepID=A0A1W0X646_HYPEX|nr:Synaptotagmin-16 [Hypsibius exemplaris]
MLQLLLTLAWNLCLLLVDRVFWSLIVVIAVTVVFAAFASKVFTFPDEDVTVAAVVPDNSTTSLLPLLPASAPTEPPAVGVGASKSLSVPRARWGKAFSYYSQEVVTNSSSDSESNDTHGRILRSLQAHEEEQLAYAIDGGIHIGPDGRDGDQRRNRWRSKHFPTKSTDAGGGRGKPDHRYQNGSLSGDRPRLQRQETVGGPFMFDVPSPIQSDEQENDFAPTLSGNHVRHEAPPLSVTARPVPSSSRWPLPSTQYSVDSFLEEQRHATSLIPNGSAGNLITVCGSVEISFFYDAIQKIMYVTLVQATNLESIGPAGIQIKLCLMPSKRCRFKTKIRHGKNPKFHECYHIRGLPPEDVTGMGLRVRLYMFEKLVRGLLIGECVVRFSSISLDAETTLWLTLEPCTALVLDTNSSNVSTNGTAELRSLSRSDSTLSAQSMPLSSSSPELLLGLAFNDITGHLKVEIIKGSRFRSPSINRPVDTFVKLSLSSSNGHTLSRAKTSVRRAQPNPIFRESFLFPVALFQLSDVTLICSIYIRRSMKRKQQIGWLSIGHSNSSAEAATHWMDFQQSRDQVCRWHTLSKPVPSSRNIFS